MARQGEIWQAEVASILGQSKAPLSAYAILEELRRTYQKVAPATVYRALNALCATGTAQRVESLNAYMVCRGDAGGPSTILSICDDCGSVDEKSSEKLQSDLTEMLEDSGFVVERPVIELHGTCADCDAERGTS